MLPGILLVSSPFLISPRAPTTTGFVIIIIIIIIIIINIEMKRSLWNEMTCK